MYLNNFNYMIGCYNDSEDTDDSLSLTIMIGGYDDSLSLTIILSVIIVAIIAAIYFLVLSPDVSSPDVSSPDVSSPDVSSQTSVTSVSVQTIAATTQVHTTTQIPTTKPTTIAPTTIASTTIAPTTIAPTTIAPTTIAPKTMVPTTIVPTTMVPTTTPVPTTRAPTTMAATTQMATTRAPTTMVPTTMVPTTTHVPTLALPNANLVVNTAYTGWRQFTVNKSLIPESLQIGQVFNAGTTPITTVNRGSYINNETYFLGNIVSYNGSNYINLSWDERNGPITSNNRGPGYSGSYMRSPDADNFVWKKLNTTTHVPTLALPNANLVVNTAYTGWRQFTVNKSLIPESLQIGQVFNAGTTPITTVNRGSYINNETYFLGNIVSYNGSNYINLSWDERNGPITSNNRGPGYSGSYMRSPDADNFVWKKLNS